MSKYRDATTEDLERRVYYFDQDYFRYLGVDNPDVTTFRDMVLRRDIRAISRDWMRLANSFLVLEKTRGHRGRPMILDGYFEYDLAVQELARRLLPDGPEKRE